MTIEQLCQQAPAAQRRPPSVLTKTLKMPLELTLVLLFLFVSVTAIITEHELLGQKSQTVKIDSASENKQEFYDKPPDNILSHSMADDETRSSDISVQLAEILATQRVQSQRLNNIEYNLMRMESMTQEKLNVLQREVHDFYTRLHQVDWQSDNIDGSIEALRNEVQALMQSITYQRQSGVCSSELDGKLNSVLVLLRRNNGRFNGFHETIKTIHNSVDILKKNFSYMSEITTKLHSFQDNEIQKNTSRNKDSRIEDTLLIGVNDSKYDNNSCPKDCFDLMRSGINASGMHQIKPSRYHKPFFVTCDMETLGGGWTVFQRRYDGSTPFSRQWSDYESGFGNMAGEFWLGLYKLHLITTTRMMDLVVHMEDSEGDKAWAYYEKFTVGSSDQQYAITSLGRYHGSAGDSLRTHVHKFSTEDNDNDLNSNINCARSGAWWYLDCENEEQISSNLNGLYLNGSISQVFPTQGMYWVSWRGLSYSLPSTKLMVRPSADVYKQLAT